MSARFCVRVDDVSQALDQSLPDVGLQYFKKWLNAWGEVDEPLYLGVVTGFLGPREKEELLVLQKKTEAVLCTHGHDHFKEVLTHDQIAKSAEALYGTNHHIPPHNLYDRDTIRACRVETAPWCVPCRPVLFGGFPGEHHDYGEAPCVVDGVLHLSAHQDLYAHSYRLVEAVGKVEDPGYPLQVVLHARWDAGTLRGVTALHKALEGRMVSTDEAWPR